MDDVTGTGNGVGAAESGGEWEDYLLSQPCSGACPPKSAHSRVSITVKNPDIKCLPKLGGGADRGLKGQDSKPARTPTTDEAGGGRNREEEP